MKAIVLEKFGGVENLIYKDIENPIIKTTEVLIKIKAISITAVDIKVRKKVVPIAEELVKHNSLILCWDISG